MPVLAGRLVAVFSQQAACMVYQCYLTGKTMPVSPFDKFPKFLNFVSVVLAENFLRKTKKVIFFTYCVKN